MTLAPRSMGYAVRTSRPHDRSLLDEIRRSVWGVNSFLPLAMVQGLGQVLQRSRARTASSTVLLSVAAISALLLGLVGIYGVVSYAAASRVREIGVRKALGARPADIGRMILGHGLSLVGIGIGLGLLAALGLTQWMASLRAGCRRMPLPAASISGDGVPAGGVSPIDPATYLIGALGLGIIALVAGYLPARRASSVDPMELLKPE